MSLTDIGVDFDAFGIGEVLKRHRLRVPDNQRAYAWKSEHVQTLFEDLSAAFDKRPAPYFLGTIVLTGKGRDVLDVADGQQRLATTSILISAIRDYLHNKGGPGLRAARKYTGEYLVKYDEFTNDDIPKLQLGPDDNDTFLRRVLSEPDSDERKSSGSPTTAAEAAGSAGRIREAAKVARAFVARVASTHSEKDAINKLFDWIKFLQSSVILIIITTSEEIDSYKMFETLNDRGLKASQTDILKNFLFSEGKNRLDEIKPRWSSMVAKIESYDDELLLDYVRHFWISMAGPTRAPELAQKFKSAVSGERQAVETILALDTSATDYVALLQALEHPRLSQHGQDARMCIHTVTNVLGIEQIRPLMLSVLRHFSVEEARIAFARFTSWSVRFLIVGGGGGGVLDRHYGLRAQEISAEGGVRTAAELSRRMTGVVPNDREFQTAFERSTVTKANLARYYLRCIENARDTKNSTPYVTDFDRPLSQFNLEHIMPESAFQAWNVPQDQVDAYLKRIGNMCLMNSAANAKAGSGSFADKTQKYADSPFLTTQDVASYATWGPEQIEARQVELAMLANAAWPL